MSISILDKELESLAQGGHGTPHQVLGVQVDPGKGGVVRTFQPFARAVSFVDLATATAQPMPETAHAGLYELPLAAAPSAGYRFRVTGEDGAEQEIEDPYRFPARMSDMDIHLHAEGTHYRTYDKLGAHVLELEGVRGVHFSVWAPNAQRVSVVGDFNRWDGRHHPMCQRGPSGLWELFVPGLEQGAVYKYEIKGQGDFLGIKSDPYAFAAELRPNTASVVWDHAPYRWSDDEWMAQRRKTAWSDRPISVYEVHPGSWKRAPGESNRQLSYRELAETLVPYVKELGFTHIELMPVSEHPFDGSWGYQTVGYFAPTSRFGSPDDLKHFIDRCHQEGIGVILDWVPAHFPRDAHGLAYFDGSHLYEHADPRLGEHMDWGTLIFNYGRNEVRAFLLSNAMYWADMFHVDGLRVDAVASMLYLDYSREDGEWIPNEFGGRENLDAVEFLKKFNEIVHEEYPGFLTFAEESTAWPMVSRPVYLGGLGFDFKWNMGWMNDTLAYFSKEPIHRRFHHNEITFSLVYAFSENFILPFSHDEVVHGKGSLLGKMPGDDWQRFAELRLLYSYMYAHPGKKLLFMGDELAQHTEWDAHTELPWDLLQQAPHRDLKSLVQALNGIYRDCPPLYEVDATWEGFEWIDIYDSDNSTLSFIRKASDPGDQLVCVFNMTPVVRHGFRLGVALPGTYREVLNTDAGSFGGSNVLNTWPMSAENVPWSDKPYSVALSLPPLAGVYLRPE